ncbi:uncharacterized protein LOC113228766 [Hyposmocoma kahamanoa]|uniref:uncharacterized protein LOC113228766 n=1 Tax=Hyposmocoma kahamanoa TaxID=1477025 RepID=UPI000E6D74F0|nr:uncharacterized protein LOC113228766 [Hyposmocoma kahamanoa]XP_026317924.1 uncharacterized protein LOC113228766 [Hyposmocoma kahamanoa]XP_026317925.1 uncharacterized protein LOC113228766 [Hyposmocoma kahamanoa]
MRLFVIILLIAPILSAPNKFTKAVYSGNHDIIRIVVPVNNINDHSKGEVTVDRGLTFFFVEADISNGKDYKGLYVSNNGTVTKLLDDGTDVTTTKDETDQAFFATKRGIYVYNYEKNTADKYGNFDEELIGIANEKGNDAIFVLTKDKKVFKIIDHGNKKIKTDYTNVDQIMLDYSNNLYFLIGKDPYVVTASGVKKVQGLPANPNYVGLAKHMAALDEGVLFVSDNRIFGISPNCTAQEFTGHEFKGTPTAISVEALVINYYAYDKKIYENNVAEAILSALLSGLKSFFDKLSFNSFVRK